MTAEQDTEQTLGTLTLGGAIATAPPLPYPVPDPDEKWELRNGFAWVYYGEGSTGIERPVIMADGFNLGRSDLAWLYTGLNRDYPLLTKLKQQRRTVVLLGFEERTASILTNAEAAREAILRTLGERQDDSPLTVGGFSMGGLITRYALAHLERQRIRHETAVYFSYDTPHRGGVIPIGIQAFAHFIPTLPGQEVNDFAKQMNSPASRQMLWRHYNSEDGSIRQDPLRTEFLEALERVGGWPQIPLKIAVANGTGNGTGLDIPAAQIALKSAGPRVFPGTTFYAQARGNVMVAQLERTFPRASKTINTSGFPELDGAPGGTLDSYKIIADALEEKGGTADLRHPTVCFVPSVSAVAIRDIDRQDDLYVNIDKCEPAESELDDYLCSSTTTAHTQITAELCEWILRKLPE
ncbi:esterase/lipase family protein [Streptomyces sp. NPDC050535]|uniref:esterase/lipase family protein n=1 Tax=Streptomyces sp. NPDC050535 TaxID=3365626 RepID=UPI0037972FB9